MKKRKRTLWEWLCFLGLPQGIMTIIVGIFVMDWWYQSFFDKELVISSFADLRTVFLLSGAVWIYIVLMNLTWLNADRKIGLFTWLETNKFEPPEVSPRKIKAAHPEIADELLSDKPDGLVIGKIGKKYVRVKLEKGNILNTMILGSTGCGKSALLLSMLIFHLHHKPKKGEKFEPMTFFVVDIKPELARKSVIIRGNKNVHVMNPQDRCSYGWDVYYNLKPDASDDDILSEMDLIARALIDGKKNEKNEFFYKHAQTIMKAVLFWQWKQGRSFMRGMHYLMDGSISDVVKNTLEKVSDKPEYGVVRRLLSPYQNKEGEAFEGIELAFRESLDIFNKQNVQFFLEGNPRKANPGDLEQKISVFFSLHEDLLEEYRCLLRLVTMQVQSHCRKRSEDAHLLCMIIDEAAVIGVDWSFFLASSRSRQIATILAYQGVGQAQDIWGKEKTKSLIELCRVIVVLSCSDPDMAKILSEWAGDYKEEKHSTNNGGNSEGTYSTSFEDKKILTQADIMSLQENKEVVAFVKGKYMRMDVEKARYYKIPELNRISEECKAVNDNNASM